MNIEHMFSVGGVEFKIRAWPVKSNTEERGPGYNVNLSPVEDENYELTPICAAIGGCWNQHDFIDGVINKGTGDCQCWTGFDFYEPDVGYEPKVRFCLGPNERGVLTHFFENEAECSVSCFVQMVLEFLGFCLENKIPSRHSADDLAKIRETFSSELAQLKD